VTAAEDTWVRVLAGPGLAVVAGGPSAGCGEHRVALDPVAASARRFAAAYVAACRESGLPVARVQRKRMLCVLQGGAS
jgi:hypothetical protein